MPDHISCIFNAFQLYCVQNLISSEIVEICVWIIYINVNGYEQLETFNHNLTYGTFSPSRSHLSVISPVGLGLGLTLVKNSKIKSGKLADQ